MSRDPIRGRRRVDGLTPVAREPRYTLKAIPLLARTAGLLGHLREEHQRSIGFQLASLAEDKLAAARGCAAGLLEQRTTGDPLHIRRHRR